MRGVAVMCDLLCAVLCCVGGLFSWSGIIAEYTIFSSGDADTLLAFKEYIVIKRS